jgi:hypothetical protein
LDSKWLDTLLNTNNMTSNLPITLVHPIGLMPYCNNQTTPLTLTTMNLSLLYKLYGLLIWPYTLEKIISKLQKPLIIFVNSLEAILTPAEWQPQLEAPNPWAANTGNWGAAWSLGKVGGTPSLGRGWCYNHGLPVTTSGKLHLSFCVFSRLFASFCTLLQI